jgi:hypothetical protein
MEHKQMNAKRMRVLMAIAGSAILLASCMSVTIQASGVDGPRQSVGGDQS